MTNHEKSSLVDSHKTSQKVRVITQQDEISEYFEQYGPIKTCRIIYKHDSTISRGFGFVIMESKEAADQILEDKDHHIIKGKWVDCKSAVLRQEMNGASKSKPSNQKNNLPERSGKGPSISHMIQSPNIGPQRSPVIGVGSGSGTGSNKQHSIHLQSASGQFTPKSQYIDTPALSYSSGANRTLKSGHSHLSHYYAANNSTKNSYHQNSDYGSDHYSPANKPHRSQLPQRYPQHLYDYRYQHQALPNNQEYYYDDQGQPYAENHQMSDAFMPAAYHEQQSDMYYEAEDPQDISQYYGGPQNYSPILAGQRYSSMRNATRPTDSRDDNLAYAPPVRQHSDVVPKHSTDYNRPGSITGKIVHNQPQVARNHRPLADLMQPPSEDQEERHQPLSTSLQTDRLTQMKSHPYEDGKEHTDPFSEVAQAKWSSITLEDNYVDETEKTDQFGSMLFLDGSKNSQTAVNTGTQFNSFKPSAGAEPSSYLPISAEHKPSPQIAKRSAISVTPPPPNTGAQQLTQDPNQPLNDKEDQFEQHSVGFLMGRPYDAEADIRSPNYSIYDKNYAMASREHTHHGAYLGSSAPHIMHGGMYSPIQQFGFLTPQDKTIIHTPSSLFASNPKGKFNTPKTETEVRKTLLEEEARKRRSGETTGFSKYYQKVVSKISKTGDSEPARNPSEVGDQPTNPSEKQT